MRILINTSNLTKGGGIQVAVSFISELVNIKNNNFYFLLVSVEVASQLDLNNFDSARFKIYTLETKKGIMSRFARAKEMKKYEQMLKPDVIFSVFGPVLWRSKTPHIVGFAIGHLIYPESPFFNFLSIKEMLKSFFKLRFRKYFFVKNSDFFITETADASERLVKNLQIDINRVFTVSNTVNEVYREYVKKNDVSKKIIQDELKLLTLSAFYSHKNLKIIKDVIPILENANHKVKFYLTIDEKNYNQQFKGYENWIVNLGPIQIKDCPKLYESMDAMFLPTLLETFTASYPEAMCMQRPILTSNLSFAKGICKDAALYFDPLNPQSIADTIVKLKYDKELYKTLVNKGINVFATIPTSHDRAISYLNIISQMK